MQEITPQSWGELNEMLFADSYNREIQRFRSPFAFRGVPRPQKELHTSIMRMSSHPEEIEGHLLRNFRKYAGRGAVTRDSIWNWLAVAQHHGLPTRLLDWTYSPYIAMHFATEHLRHMNEDGVIWCMDFVKAKQFVPDRLRQLLEKEGSDVFTVEMLDSAAETLEEFDGLSTEEFVVFIEPPSLEQRIVIQSALFSFMSGPALRLGSWLKKHPELYRKIIVAAGLKWEIRDKLDQANINERVIFPGLDGLSRWLKRYYGSKGLPAEPGE